MSYETEQLQVQVKALKAIVARQADAMNDIADLCLKLLNDPKLIEDPQEKALAEGLIGLIPIAAKLVLGKLAAQGILPTDPQPSPDVWLA